MASEYKKLKSAAENGCFAILKPHEGGYHVDTQELDELQKNILLHHVPLGIDPAEWRVVNLINWSLSVDSMNEADPEALDEDE